MAHPSLGPMLGAQRSPNALQRTSATVSQNGFLGPPGPEHVIQGLLSEARPLASWRPSDALGKGAPSAPLTQPGPNLLDHKTLVQPPPTFRGTSIPWSMICDGVRPRSTPQAPSSCLNKAESAPDTLVPPLGSPCRHWPSSTCQDLGRAHRLPGPPGPTLGPGLCTCSTPHGPSGRAANSPALQLHLLGLAALCPGLVVGKAVGQGHPGPFSIPYRVRRRPTR